MPNIKIITRRWLTGCHSSAQGGKLNCTADHSSGRHIFSTGTSAGNCTSDILNLCLQNLAERVHGESTHCQLAHRLYALAFHRPI